MTRRSRVEAVLEKMDIGHRSGHFPAQLSGGQQQRVAVARAIVNNPNLILADEPTGNLDSEHGEEVMKMLLKLNEEGTTILMVTHSADQCRLQPTHRQSARWQDRLRQELGALGHAQLPRRCCCALSGARSCMRRSTSPVCRSGSPAA